MTLEGRLTAREIVMEAGMSARPEYYSGRGAITCDLNSQQLKQIHELIKKEHGDKAAQNFVKLVANAKDLAASNFLTCLYHLESIDWEYSRFKSDLPGGIAVPKDENGEYNLTVGMVGMMAALSRGNIDETEMIRNPFLEHVGMKLSPQRHPYYNTLTHK